MKMSCDGKQLEKRRQPFFSVGVTSAQTGEEILRELARNGTGNFGMEVEEEEEGK